MMPLCTSAIRRLPSQCGWLFRSVLAPCVAHRVCPIPITPSEWTLMVDLSFNNELDPVSESLAYLDTVNSPYEVIVAIPDES
jgi:hypothetical protein